MAQVKFFVGEPVYGYPLYAFDRAIEGIMSPPTNSTFSVGQAPGFQVDFKGSFTVAGGAVTGGTVTSFEILLGNTKLGVGKALSVDAGALYQALQGDEDGVYELLFQSAPLNFKGSAMDDVWEGNEFNAKILGQDGNDRLIGGAGDERIKGGDGNDLVVGGAGNDKLWGGKGNDVFGFEVHEFAPMGIPRIKDFKVGEDMISLGDFTQELDPGFLDPSQFHKGGSASDPNQVVIYQKSTGSIFLDFDGSGADPQYLLAKVKAGTKLEAGDFFVEPFILF